MKLLLISALMCVTMGSANTDPITEKEKTKKVEEGVKKENASTSKNFHSVKRWKITVEHTNGDIISKTIVLAKDTSVSAMEMAFTEAEKYIGKLNNVKNYSVSPVSTNAFVLLAGN